MLEDEEGGPAGAEGEVLRDFRALLPAGFEALKAGEEALADEGQRDHHWSGRCWGQSFRPSPWPQPMFPSGRLVNDGSVFFPSSRASMALDCSRASRYFRKRIQEVCPV